MRRRESREHTSGGLKPRTNKEGWRRASGPTARQASCRWPYPRSCLPSFPGAPRRCARSHPLSVARIAVGRPYIALAITPAPLGSEPADCTLMRDPRPKMKDLWLWLLASCTMATTTTTQVTIQMAIACVRRAFCARSMTPPDEGANSNCLDGAPVRMKMSASIASCAIPGPGLVCAASIAPRSFVDECNDALHRRGLHASCVPLCWPWLPACSRMLPGRPSPRTS